MGNLGFNRVAREQLVSQHQSRIWKPPGNQCVSKPYVRGSIMRQDAHTRQAQALRICEIPWYQRLGVMLVAAVGIGGQILVLWIVGQILLLLLGA